MRKFNLNCVCIIKKFNNHLKYKKDLLNYFEKENETIKQSDDYYSDYIYKLDFAKAGDFNRPWVKLIYEDFFNHFKDCAFELGYENLKFSGIWFQQYEKTSTHGWHIHANNYTGVYYVNFKNNFAKTQLINPSDENKIIEINVSEGDIVIFPSFIIHRSEPHLSDLKKTIISFNIDFLNINRRTLNKINNLKEKINV